MRSVAASAITVPGGKIAAALHYDDRFVSLLVAVAFRAIVALETPAVAERRDRVLGRKFGRFGEEAAGEEEACRQSGEDGYSRRHDFARAIAEPTVSVCSEQIWT